MVLQPGTLAIRSQACPTSQPLPSLSSNQERLPSQLNPNFSPQQPEFLVSLGSLESLGPAPGPSSTYQELRSSCTPSSHVSSVTRTAPQHHYPSPPTCTGDPCLSHTRPRARPGPLASSGHDHVFSPVPSPRGPPPRGAGKGGADGDTRPSATHLARVCPAPPLRPSHLSDRVINLLLWLVP